MDSKRIEGPRQFHRENPPRAFHQGSWLKTLLKSEVEDAKAGLVIDRSQEFGVTGGRLACPLESVFYEEE